MAEDLRLGRVALDNDPELFTDLCTPTVSTDSGKISVESKGEIKNRLRRSPNKGDACCYGNWVRDRRPLNRKLTEEQMEEAGIVVGGPNHDVGLQRVLKRLEKQHKALATRATRRYNGRKR